MLHEKVSAHASIAASILTFALATVEFSNLTLTKWWHFVLTSLVLITLFVFLLIAIEIILIIVAKCKRPGPNVDFKKEYANIGENVHALYRKDVEFATVVSTEYKEVILEEILLLSKTTKKNIERYIRDYRNPVLKEHPKIPDESLLQLYKKYCEVIIAKYESNDDENYDNRL